MSIFKRAILYITRKKVKSIIMLLILFGMATAVLSGISIKKATNLTKQDLSSQIANKFEVKANLGTNFDGTVPESLINKILNVNGIKSYDGMIQGAGLDFKELDYVEPKKSTIQYKDERYNLACNHDPVLCDSLRRGSLRLEQEETHVVPARQSDKRRRDFGYFRILFVKSFT